MLKKFVFLLLSLVCIQVATAQVTTSGINGKVTSNGEDVIGATVQAVHQPTGTRYAAVTNTKGRYNIQGMRVGGPYQITISYVGHKSKVLSKVNLSLGDDASYDVDLEEDAKQLGEITVTGNKKSFGGSGASTNFKLAKIESAPTIDRNIYDVAKLSPLVNVSKIGGISIAGSNNRYNSFQIDGIVSNDVFGLASSGTNGGQTDANPISMEAIQELQVVASPFDVRQGGFTGGGINAITKSGTNTFHASVYGYYTNENLYGRYNQVKDETAMLGDQSTKTWGVSLAGPLVKDKLFFYTNLEYKKNTYPTSSYNPGYLADYVTEDEANTIINTYKKYTGNTETYGVQDIDTRGTSFLARLDWNIDDLNKFTLRYQLNDSYKDVWGSGSSTYVFNNSGYKIADRTNSIVMELNSQLTPKLHNEARLGMSFVRDHREVPYDGANVTIKGLGSKQSRTAYIGTEYSSGANTLDQDIWTLEDNLTYNTGNHSITLGTHNEFYRMKNLFIQAATGSWYYKSLQDFVDDKPYQFSYNYSDVDLTGTTKWAGVVEAAQFGFYLQDKWSVNRNLTLNYGLRIDIPTTMSSPSTNDEFNASTYATANGVKVGEVPSAKVMWSPRFGFRWYTDDAHKSLLRGGVGLFTGRVPFVWLSNLWNNTGVEMKGTTITSNVPGMSQYANDPLAAANSATGRASKPTINTASKDFKYPQVLRANLAWEYTLPLDIKMTLEGLYSKTLNNVWFENLALSDNGKRVYAVSSDYANASTTYFDRNAGSYYAIINLKNTNKGYSYSFSATLEKSFDFGLDLMASYTFGHAKSVNDGTSSVAYSNWKYNYSINSNDASEVSYSIFDVPHKVIATAAYTTPKYGNGRWATNFAVTYNGFTGQRYSLTMNENADFNNDGQYGNSLLYIPTSDEISKMTFASEDDRTNFESWIENDKYAQNHRGQFAQRNSNSATWENHFDLHFSQSFYYLKERGSKIELSFDVINFANMLNKKWGTSYSGAYNEQILRVTKMTKDANSNYTPTYSFIGDTPQIADISSRWHAQIGMKITF
jgi:hypothetical protein